MRVAKIERIKMDPCAQNYKRLLDSNQAGTFRILADHNHSRRRLRLVT